MFADELRRAIEAAPRITLPQVTALLWRAYGEEQITEAEAESLSVLIEARRSSGSGPRLEQGPNPRGTYLGSETDSPQDRQSAPRRPSIGSRPRTDASMGRRRRWAASGRLPPQLAARFTLAEVAVLAVVAAEAAQRRDCRLAVDHLAAVAGVSRSTVKATLRLARGLGLLTIEERRLAAWRNDTNVVRVVSPEWLAWMRLTRRAACPGGGVKSSTPTNTKVLESGRQRPAAPGKEASEVVKAGAPRLIRGRPRFARPAAG